MKNSELGFVGDERLYLSYSFPVLRGETMEGLCPLHPQQGHCPCTHFPETAIHITQTMSRWNSVTRTQIFADEDCIFASWMRHWRPPTGWAVWNTAGRMLCIRGKHEKRSEGKQAFPADFFQCFHSARGFSFRSPSNKRKEVWENVFYVAERVQGRWPCCGVQGLHKPLLRHFLESKRKERGEPLSVIVNQQF